MAAHFLSRLRPAQALVHDAVDATTYLVDQGHESTARAVVGAVSLVPGLAAPARAVDGVRRFFTRGVLGTIRGVNRTVEGVSGIALDQTTLGDTPEPTVPLRSDAIVTPEGAMDQLVGALNGAVGDHLADSDNGLDLGLRLRHGAHWLDLDADALERDIDAPTGRVVVLVHGLCTTELSWSLYADEALGAADANYGELLRQELGFTPVYARYNTGRTVEDSGHDLADALEALVANWPVPVEELVVIGHSMGGLVARAATSAARTRELKWSDDLKAMICLGSPHDGAPLARFGHAAAEIFQTIDLPATQIIGTLIANRSAGVHDLRHRGLEATGPLLRHVRYLFVAGTLSESPDLFGTSWLGDLLVPVESATAPEGRHVTIRHFGGVAHHRLQAHAGVYGAIREHLEAPC